MATVSEIIAAPDNTELALVLGQALRAAEQLRAALAAAACHQAAAAAHLAHARSLVGAAYPPVGAVCTPAALSPREAEVLGLLAAGRSNHAIASVLYLSPRTVQRHIANAYLKIGAHCRAEATAYALRHGFV